MRGYGLMAGFYKREREETFDADGWYRTGDRSYLEDGRVFFTGRYTEMIKSGGANVAPLEVETVFQSFPEIRYAFVFGMPHAERGEEVTAVLVLEEGSAFDPDDIRRRVRAELSAYKVPTNISVIAPRRSALAPERQARQTHPQTDDSPTQQGWRHDGSTADLRRAPRFAMTSRGIVVGCLGRPRRVRHAQLAQPGTRAGGGALDPHRPRLRAQPGTHAARSPALRTRTRAPRDHRRARRRPRRPVPRLEHAVVGAVGRLPPLRAP